MEKKQGKRYGLELAVGAAVLAAQYDYRLFSDAKGP